MYSINLPCKKGAAAVNLFMVQKEPFRIGTLLAYQIEYIQKKCYCYLIYVLKCNLYVPKVRTIHSIDIRLLFAMSPNIRSNYIY